jgi:hypothetical protein
VDTLMPACVSKYLTYSQLSAIRAKALKKLAKSN